MKRTVSIPIELQSSSFLPLMAYCAEIFNAHVDWALENKTCSKTAAHKALYEQLKAKYPNVPTAFIQAIRDTAMEALKATGLKKRPRKKKYSGIRFDKRTMTLRGNQLTLSTLGKRAKVILQVPEYYKSIFNSWKLKGATLTYSVNTKQFWIRLVYEIDTPPVKTTGEVIGIDRGLIQLAATSEGQFFSNQEIRASQRRHLYNRKTAQSKGTPSARRRLKAMSGKEKRFSKDVNHCITKKLVSLDHAKTFVLEDLSGIRNQRKGRKMNKRLGSWPFHQFELFLTYKAEASGKEVVYVDPRYTSQMCSGCHVIEKSNRKKSKYHCAHCGLKLHADVNSANNLKEKYLSSTKKPSEEQAAVIRPHVTIGNSQSQAYCLVR